MNGELSITVRGVARLPELEDALREAGIYIETETDFKNGRHGRVPVGRTIYISTSAGLSSFTSHPHKKGVTVSFLEEEEEEQQEEEEGEE